MKFITEQSYVYATILEVCQYNQPHLYKVSISVIIIIYNVINIIIYYAINILCYFNIHKHTIHACI